MAKWFGLILAFCVVLVGGIAVWRSLHHTPPVQGAAAPAPGPAGAMGARQAPARDEGEGCSGSPTFTEAARENAQSAASLQWAPYGRPEAGWMIYWPLIAHEVGAGCGPSTTAFAEAIANWQAAKNLKVDGVLAPEQFEIMKVEWYRRMYHAPGATRDGCSAPPPTASAATADPAESYGGKTIQLDPQVLDAYRHMVAAARAETPDLKDQPLMLQIFSGFRAPDADAAECAERGGCVGPTKSKCSNHRTGRALDLVMGAAPGQRVDSSDDSNRLYMSQTSAYRWMVANAGRFGFHNYPFEPWHWEFTGQG